MSPIRPCPSCGRSTDFHVDELERVEDGSAMCLQCGMEFTRSAFVIEAIAGEHDDLLSLEEDDEEIEGTDDE